MAADMHRSIETSLRSGTSKLIGSIATLLDGNTGLDLPSNCGQSPRARAYGQDRARGIEGTLLPRGTSS